MNAKRRSFRFWQLPVLLAVVLALGLGTALAGSASTALPNGAALEVSIDDPLTSTEFLIPTGDTTRDVDVSGTASVGLGEPDATFIYVMDVSGSTSIGGGTGCAPILDCEQTFFKALNAAVIGNGSADEVGFVVFGQNAATADMSPLGADQIITAPDADTHVNTVIDSTGSGSVGDFTAKNVGSGATNYAAGLQKALDVVNASTNTQNIVVFGSDGVSNTGGIAAFNAAVAALAATGAKVKPIAIGTGVSCATGTDGTLNGMAIGPSPTFDCEQIQDPGNLPNIIPDLISTSLDSLEIEVDGGGKTTIPNSDISVSLPEPGPVSVSYTTTVPGLDPGDHEICVTATGTDTAGTASVTRCETIHLLQISLAPDGVVNELGTSGQTHTVTATVAGPASVAGRTVDFEITSGPNITKMGSDATNAAGEATFTYTAEQGLAGLGTDTIRSCITLDTPLGETGCDEVTKDWVDTTPPEPACTETVNPHGNKVPPAGSTTLPGPKGGQNEDGFYELSAWDAVDPNPAIYVADSGSGAVFGPFASGDKIKYTEDSTAMPTAKMMGSDKGKAGAIDAHIIGNGDPLVIAVDASGNQSDPLACLVPPLPK